MHICLSLVICINSVFFFVGLQNFGDFKWILIVWFIHLSFQTFQPLIVIYKRGNASIYQPLSHSLRSLILYKWKIEFLYKSKVGTLCKLYCPIPILTSPWNWKPLFPKTLDIFFQRFLLISCLCCTKCTVKKYRNGIKKISFAVF